MWPAPEYQAPFPGSRQPTHGNCEVVKRGQQKPEISRCGSAAPSCRASLPSTAPSGHPGLKQGLEEAGSKDPCGNRVAQAQTAPNASPAGTPVPGWGWLVLRQQGCAGVRGSPSLGGWWPEGAASHQEGDRHPGAAPWQAAWAAGRGQAVLQSRTAEKSSVSAHQGTGTRVRLGPPRDLQGGGCSHWWPSTRGASVPHCSGGGTPASRACPR